MFRVLECLAGRRPIGSSCRRKPGQFERLRQGVPRAARVGLIDRIPRLASSTPAPTRCTSWSRSAGCGGTVASQHGRCRPYYRDGRPETSRSTIASAIEINRPVNLTMHPCAGVVQRLVREATTGDSRCQGPGGRRRAGLRTGLGRQVAGVKKLVAKADRADERVVCILTPSTERPRHRGLPYDDQEQFNQVLAAAGSAAPPLPIAPWPCRTTSMRSSKRSSCMLICRVRETHHYRSLVRFTHPTSNSTT